jgi:CHASE3 domain sensor protein
MVAGGKLLRRMLMVGSAVVLVTTLQVLPNRIFRQTKVAQQWVDHTLQALNARALTPSTMEAAETAERGYLLTGDTVSVQQFQAAQSNLIQARTKLRLLTKDNEAQQARIARVENSLGIRISLLSQGIDLYRSDGPKVAVANGGAAFWFTPGAN